MGDERPLRQAVIIALVLAISGCASLASRTSGVDGPIEWQAVDLKLERKDLNSPWVYSFTLELRDTRGRNPIYIEMERQLYQPGTGSFSATLKGRWDIPKGGVLRIPLWSTLRCQGLGEGCQGATVPIPLWRITLRGLDEGGGDIVTVIDLRLPADPSAASPR